MKYIILLLILISTQPSFADGFGLFSAEKDPSSQAALIRRATVAIVQKDKMTDKHIFSFDETYRLCNASEFAKEKLWSNCSGVLISKNIVLTAGHCILSQTDCSDKNYVFDYLDNSVIDQIQANPAQAYKCKKVLAWSKPVRDKQLVDYALIQLDRDVTDRQPVKLSNKKLTEVENIFAFGFPLGMPMKMSAGFVDAQDALINKTSQAPFFKAKMSTHPGLSGGGVYDSDFNLVGLVVRGDANIDREERCQRVRKCEADDCPWAEIQKIDAAKIINIFKFSRVHLLSQ